MISMKKLAILFCAIALTSFAFTTSTTNAKKGKLTISWSFLNIVEGYDHESKCHIWIDDKDMGESTVTAESVPNHMDFKIKAGKHKIKVANIVKYDGKWENHTVENQYSIDALYEGDVLVKKNSVLEITFDLDNGTTAVLK
jgi:hypothetical protein